MQQPGLLSIMLRAMQVSDSLLLSERYEPPWHVALPDSQGLASLFGFSPDTHVVAFHLVRHGHLQISLGNESAHTVHTGEVPVLFGGAAHQLWCRENVPKVALHELLQGHVPGGAPGESPGESLGNHWPGGQASPTKANQPLPCSVAPLICATYASTH